MARGYNVTFVGDYVVATVSVAADPHGGPIPAGDLTQAQSDAVARTASALAASDGFIIEPSKWEEISDA